MFEMRPSFNTEINTQIEEDMNEQVPWGNVAHSVFAVLRRLFGLHKMG